MSGYDFLALEQPWLREAAKWHMKVALETGLLRWPTIRQRLYSLTIFGRFIAARGITEPWLCADPTDLRLLALDFLAAVKQRRATAGPRRGELIRGATVHNILTDVEQFYAWMADHKLEAARALRRSRAGSGWATSTPACGVKARSRASPSRPTRTRCSTDPRWTQLMRHAGVLAAPKDEGGLGDEQAMRILMLLARTGRRVSEILLLDFDPILPITGIAAEARRERPRRGRREAALPADQDRRRAGHDLRRPGGRRDRPRPAAVGARARPRAVARPGRAAAALPVPRDHPQQSRPPPLPQDDARRAHEAARRAGRHPRQPRTPAAALQRPPLPPHPRHQPDQRERAGARGAAIPRAPVAQDDDALLQDAPRDARAGVPAPQEDHRRRPAISISTRATCSR